MNYGRRCCLLLPIPRAFHMGGGQHGGQDLATCYLDPQPHTYLLRHTRSGRAFLHFKRVRVNLAVHFVLTLDPLQLGSGKRVGCGLWLLGRNGIQEKSRSKNR